MTTNRSAARFADGLNRWGEALLLFAAGGVIGTALVRLVSAVVFGGQP